MSKSTPINQLRRDDTDNAELVQNILNDFESQDSQMPPQQQMQQPSQQQMPQQQMPQQMPQQMHQQQQNVQYYDDDTDEEFEDYGEPIYQDRELSTTDQVIAEAKRPLLVVLLVFLTNFAMVDDMLLKNFAQLGTDGSLNMMGVAAKAVVAGLIYYLVNKFVL